MLYSNWHLIGKEPQNEMAFSFWDIFNMEIIYDMKQELIPLCIAAPLFIAARMYNNHLDRLEEEYLD